MFGKPSARRLAYALILALMTQLLSSSPPAYALERIGGVSIEEDRVRAEAAPTVSMPAGVLRTADGRTLWDRDMDAQRSMASTTKIMTALVVLEKTDITEQVTVSPAAAAVGEAGIVLAPGDTLSVQQLLEAMLVQSANNAAFALAEHVAGGEEEFVDLMNEKALALGLERTSFTNPHGLDEPGHRTSAADLATLSAVAMADPRFAAIVAMPKVSVTTRGRTATYENSNKLIGAYDGATGVKTGWTNDAGYCLVSSARRGGVGFIAVVLGAASEKDRFDQARELLDWGFAHYAEVQVASAEATAALVPVSAYLDRTVPAVVSGDAVVPVFDLDGDVVTRVDVLGEVEAPVEKGQRLGTLTVVQGQRLLAQVPVVAAEDVPEPDGWEAMEIWLTRLWRGLFGGERQADAVMLM